MGLFSTRCSRRVSVAQAPSPATAVRQVPPVGERNPGPAGQPVLHSSLLGSIQGGDLPALPADLDLPLFSACDAPTLLKVGRVSKTCEQAIKHFLAQAGEPDGIQNEIRRKRFMHSKNKAWRNIAAIETSLTLLETFRDHACGEGAPSSQAMAGLSAAFAEKKMSHIYLDLSFFAPTEWAKISRAVCDAGPLKSLDLNLCELPAEGFSVYAEAALNNARSSVNDGELTILLNTALSVRDAKKFINQLRSMPECRVLRWRSPQGSPKALTVICARLALTCVTEVRIDFILPHQKKDLFALLLANPNLKNLHLRRVGMSGPKILALANALTTNRTLEKLTLAHDTFSDDELSQLFDAIAGHPRLCSLHIEPERLSQTDFAMTCQLRKNPDFADLGGFMIPQPPGASPAYLLEALSNRKNLTCVGLSLVFVTPDIIPVLEKIVVQNHELRRLATLVLSDPDVLEALAGALKKARTPLYVECIAAQAAIDFLMAVARSNPLLNFTFNEKRTA